MCSGNAAGSFAPLYVNYRAKEFMMKGKNGGPPRTRYNRTKSGWMDSCTFDDSFQGTMLLILKETPGKKVVELANNL